MIGVTARRLVVASVILVLAVVLLPWAVGASEDGEEVGCEGDRGLGLGERPWLLPFEPALEADPAAQQREYYDFMWRTFIALNWPAEAGRRGKPDCAGDVFAEHLETPRVWETYPGPLEVFLKPEEWDPYPTWEQLGSPGGKTLGHHKIPPAAILVNQPGTGNLSLVGADDFPTGPLVDRNGRYVVYEVGINRAYFEYIRRFRYYDSESQLRAVEEYLLDPASPRAFRRPPLGNEPYLLNLPRDARQGMVEVKAAWRDLDGVPSEHWNRYVRRRVEVELIDVDPPNAVEIGERHLGLVALHVLRFTPDGLVAATFEQVDNVEVGHSAPDGLAPSFNSGAPPSPLQQRIGFANQTAARPTKIPPPISPENPLRCDAVPRDRACLASCADGAACGISPCEPRQPGAEPAVPCCCGAAVPVDVYRVSPIPAGIQRVNAEYQARLFRRDLRDPTAAGYSPLAFYQLIGTQNRHAGDDFSDPETNGHEGPKTGVYTNANNLINTALESYTQENFSCIGCHVAARPLGVTQASYGVDHFKILSFLMRRACLRTDMRCATDADCCSQRCATETDDGLACSPPGGSPGTAR